jgi:hypothetical protein
MKDSSIVKELIDKMFEIAGYELGYIDMVKRSDDWYSQYTMTQEQNDQWFKWGQDLIYKRKIVPTKRLAKKEMSWFNLNYGLKIK